MNFDAQADTVNSHKVTTKKNRNRVERTSYRPDSYIFSPDLRDGTIPILTTKKINVDPLRKELEWFISGSGSERRLSEMGVGIWKNWATVDGHLNYVVGYRDWETDRKSTRLNSSHSAKSRMPSSA